MIATERIPTMEELFSRYEEALKESGNGKLKLRQKRPVVAYKFWSIFKIWFITLLFLLIISHFLNNFDLVTIHYILLNSTC